MRSAGMKVGPKKAPGAAPATQPKKEHAKLKEPPVRKAGDAVYTHGARPRAPAMPAGRKLAPSLHAEKPIEFHSVPNGLSERQLSFANDLMKKIAPKLVGRMEHARQEFLFGTRLFEPVASFKDRSVAVTVAEALTKRCPAEEGEKPGRFGVVKVEGRFHVLTPNQMSAFKLSMQETKKELELDARGRIRYDRIKVPGYELIDG